LIGVCAERASARVGGITLLIGPEGGWSDAELAHVAGRGLTRARLTETILRVETAAVAAATVACVCRTESFKSGR
jgi:16S rRNA (uracil1498-N3)-methyltransferase